MSIALPLVQSGFCSCRSRALTSLKGIAPAMYPSASSALDVARGPPDHERELGLVVDELRSARAGSTISCPLPISELANFANHIGAVGISWPVSSAWSL